MPPPPSTPDPAPDSGAPLSEELERSVGMIAPANPGVDPGMVQLPPNTGGTNGAEDR